MPLRITVYANNDGEEAGVLDLTADLLAKAT
jgi:hypothetical protein